MANNKQAILVIDSAMNGCGVAVRTGDNAFAQVKPMNMGQAEHLMPMVEAVMAQAGIDYNALGSIVTTMGPGAFTGLRIGLSTARALGLSLDIPVYGLNTLQALALAYCLQEKPKDGFCVAIDTKRGDFYAQFFDGFAKALNLPQAISGEDLVQQAEGQIVIGDAGSIVINNDYRLVDPAVIGKIFLSDRRDEFFVLSPAPIYLREAEVSFSKTRQRVMASEA